MSAPRTLVALAAGLLLAAGIGEAQAQTIVARVGDVAGRQYEYVDVPITVDMRGAPGLRLGSYRATLRWDPQVLGVGDGLPGNFAYPLGNGDSASFGVVRLTAIQPSGADGLVTLVVVRFQVLDETRSTSIVLTFDEMSAAGTFENLLPYLTGQSGAYCRALGTWGDVDGDGRANSRDALVALSKVVGLLRARDTIAVDTVYVDSITTRYDTVATMHPSLADVDADGAVTSRDALIIMTHAVGLPIGDFRIGQRAAGSCTAQGTVTLTVSPDTLELQSLQYAPVVVTARDAAGRPVSTANVVWRSSNTAVAAHFSEDGFPAVVARDPGIAVLTAELTPNVRASLVVNVVARRVHWYVDAVRATNVPTQTGSPRHPMAFIGNALDYAQDGDTIHVAPGNYEEVVDRWVSVAIVGDSVNRPVIDARSYPSYNAWSTKAVRLGSRPGLVTLQNLRIVGGGVLVGSHDLVVRNVRIDAPGAQDVFMFAGPMNSGYGDAPAALRPVAADVPIEPAGKALIDGLYVAGYQETGIVAMYVDSVTIRNSTAARDSLGSVYCYPTSLQYAGIAAVYIGSSTELRDNTVAKAPCSAIRVIQSSGRAVISRNRVLGARAGGIVVAADTVELDHNLVRDVQPYSEYPAVGIEVTDEAQVRKVVSRGDSVINVGRQGFTVDSTLVGVIDSLFVDSTAQDHVWNQPGVALRGGRFTLRNSHISNTWGENAVTVCGWNATLTSRGNHITRPGFNGISAYDCTGYSDGPDSLVSVADTVIEPYSLYATGIRAEYGTYAWVDSSVTTSGMASDTVMGVGFVGVSQAVLRDSKVTGFRNETGVYAENGGSVLLVRDSVVGAGWGIWLSNNSDTSRVHRTVVKDSWFTGIGTQSGAVLRADSIKVYGSTFEAMVFDDNGGGRVTDSWLEDNGYAVTVGAANGTAGLVFRGSTFANNDSGTVRNLSSATVDAQQNWWGTTVVPDSARISGPVDFTNFLTSAPVLPLAPPAWRAMAIAAGAERASQAALRPPHRDSSHGRGAQPGGAQSTRRAPSLPAPTSGPGAEARIREYLARPAAPWRRGEAPNQPAPRNN